MGVNGLPCAYDLATRLTTVDCSPDTPWLNTPPVAT
jgi:hypothetical protein